MTGWLPRVDAARARQMAELRMATRQHAWRRRWRTAALVTPTVVVAGLLPAAADPYVTSVAATGCVFALLAISVHLLTSQCRLPSFAQPAYLGVGAYTAALLSTHGVRDAAIQLTAAGAAAAVAAAVTAPLVLRTRATTFLLATFALQHLATTVAAQWTSVTGGDEGLHTPPAWLVGIPLAGVAVTYWWALTVLLVVAAATAVLVRSRRGLVWRGCAGHEQRMSSLGYRPGVQFGLAYMFAGAIAGAGGAVVVVVNRYVSPHDLGFDIAALTLLAAAIGGTSLATTIAGAATIVAARDLIGPATGGHTLAVLGALFLTAAHGRAALNRRTRTAPTPPGSRPAQPLPPPDDTDHPEHQMEEALEQRRERAIRLLKAMRSESFVDVDRVSHRFGAVTALDDISLAVPVGARHAVIGANGAGKSTLLNLLAGTHRPTHGRIRLAGHDITRLDPARRARRRMGRTFQHPALADELTARQNVALAITVLADRGNCHRTAGLLDRAGDWLIHAGLAEYVDTPVAQLPYGIRRRIELIGLLIRPPLVLLLDEPSAGLDQHDIDALAATLRGLPPTTTVLLVDHHLDLLWAVADTVTVLDHGQHLITGTPEQVRADPTAQAAYLNPTARPCPAAIASGTAPARPPTLADTAAPARLRVEHLTIGHGDAVTVRDITLHAEAGEILLLAGRNGAGKSTLVNTIGGLLPALSGTVHLDGAPLPGGGYRTARAGISTVVQGRRLFATLTVDEHLTAARTMGGPWTRDSVLDLFPYLTPRLRHHPQQLSGGEQQLLAVARALLSQPRVLLLDEPGEGLAPAVTATLHAAIRAVADHDVAVLVTATDPRHAIDIATRVLILDSGRLTPHTPIAAGHAPTEALHA